MKYESEDEKSKRKYKEKDSFSEGMDRHIEGLERLLDEQRAMTSILFGSDDESLVDVTKKATESRLRMRAYLSAIRTYEDISNSPEVSQSERLEAARKLEELVERGPSRV